MSERGGVSVGAKGKVKFSEKRKIEDNRWD